MAHITSHISHWDYVFDSSEIDWWVLEQDPLVALDNGIFDKIRRRRRVIT